MAVEQGIRVSAARSVTHQRVDEQQAIRANVTRTIYNDVNTGIIVTEEKEASFTEKMTQKEMTIYKELLQEERGHKQMLTFIDESKMLGFHDILKDSKRLSDNLCFKSMAPLTELFDAFDYWHQVPDIPTADVCTNFQLACHSVADTHGHVGGLLNNMPLKRVYELLYECTYHIALAEPDGTTRMCEDADWNMLSNEGNHKLSRMLRVKMATTTTLWNERAGTKYGLREDVYAKDIQDIKFCITGFADKSEIMYAHLNGSPITAPANYFDEEGMNIKYQITFEHFEPLWLQNIGNDDPCVTFLNPVLAADGKVQSYDDCVAKFTGTVTCVDAHMILAWLAPDDGTSRRLLRDCVDERYTCSRPRKPARRQTSCMSGI
jgi:hypothetical protein